MKTKCFNIENWNIYLNNWVKEKYVCVNHCLKGIDKTCDIFTITSQARDNITDNTKILKTKQEWPFSPLSSKNNATRLKENERHITGEGEIKSALYIDDRAVSL